MDFSFSEMLMVAIIAFLVLGPEQFIKKSGQLGKLLGKIKTQFNNFKVMIEQEIMINETAPINKIEDSSDTAVKESAPDDSDQKGNHGFD